MFHIARQYFQVNRDVGEKFVRKNNSTLVLNGSGMKEVWKYYYERPLNVENLVRFRHVLTKDQFRQCLIAPSDRIV